MDEALMAIKKKFEGRKTPSEVRKIEPLHKHDDGYFRVFLKSELYGERTTDVFVDSEGRVLVLPE